MAKLFIVSHVLYEASRRLHAARIDSAWLDAELLLAHVLKKDRAWLLAHSEYRLTQTQRKRFTSLLRRRAKRVPLAYLTGEKEFYGLRFRVSPAVLIPRPETERLIELALPYLKKLLKGSIVADIGTGSGCIAITLARLLPDLRFIATDASAAALAVARANARRHRVSSRIRFIRDRTFAALNHRGLSAIIANLPYLSRRELLGVQPELRREPRGALVAGARGDEVIRALLHALARSDTTANRTQFFLELNPTHAQGLARFAATCLPTLNWNIRSDIADHPRFLLGLP